MSETTTIETLRSALIDCLSTLVAAQELLACVYSGKLTVDRPEWDVINTINKASIKHATEALAASKDDELPKLVQQWAKSGELPDEAPSNLDDVLDQCGRLLDDSCSHEILGNPVFLGDDGHLYQIGVQAVVERLDAEFYEEHQAMIDAFKAAGPPQDQ